MILQLSAQVQLVKRITRITTRILPEGDGVALRFINQNANNSDKLSFPEIGKIMEKTSWQRNGDTAIGTYLKSKILEPLVYSKLRPQTLARPLLISVISRRRRRMRRSLKPSRNAASSWNRPGTLVRVSTSILPFPL